MSIEDRNLKAGTKLVASYKGTEYTAEVLKTKDGLRYRLEGDREFKSPSSAGRAVMGGSACNGWRFWTVASETPEEPAAKATAPPVFEPMEDQVRAGRSDPLLLYGLHGRLHSAGGHCARGLPERPHERELGLSSPDHRRPPPGSAPLLRITSAPISRGC